MKFFLNSLFSVNLKAVINVSQIVAKKMIENGHAGTIVNVINCKFSNRKMNIISLNMQNYNKENE